jgi:hypothetical protein
VDLRRGAITPKVVDDRLKEWKALLMPLAYPRHFQRWGEFRRSLDKRPCKLDPATGKLATGAANEHKLPGLPDPNCGDPGAPVGEMLDYDINWMRAWVDARIAWLDKNLPGTCAK